MYKSFLYNNAPIAVQELLINIKAFVFKCIRENWLYKKRLKKLLENQTISRSELVAQQKLLLDEILSYAVKNVPKYQNVNNSSIEDFNVIEKEDVRTYSSDYISLKNRVSMRFKSQTGGTTGKPLNLVTNLSGIIEDHAQSYRQLLWAGFQHGDKRLWLRADLIVPLSQVDAPYWRNNIVDNMLMMSVYHLNENTVHQYLNQLHKYSPAIIQAYPSAIYLFANLIISQGLTVNLPIKGIVLSSESYTVEQKKLIERVFKTQVFSWYGLSERVATVGTCSYGKQHLIEDYGFYEFTADGTLIATGLHNSVMPLIRYNTDDIFSGVSQEYVECQCGLPFLTIEGIQGRKADYLISDTGNKVSIFNHIPKGVNGLIELQLKQVKLGEIITLVVTDSNFTKLSELKLIENVKSYLGQGMIVFVKQVDNIPRTKNGKFRQAVLELES
jgi:phenylacetate-CoA ligase